MEFRVNIYIETSRRGPSVGTGKYMYLIEFLSKKTGERLTKPCSIRIFTGCNHILSTTHNSWHIEWQKNGWKKKNGEPIKNAALWEELVAVMDKHAVSYTKDEHSYKSWMQEQMKGG